ncbi:MAG: LacI family DNA-binding transcriptional regulator [Sphingobacteriaceae bacterium]|nr:LacI family DNA-binding transcriptional regulator [Sphingobacteriaceae bacterium]
MTKKRVTIYHLAEELGMSVSYVSRALNNHPLVNQKIKDRVKKRATELNYKPNANAANLRQGSSRTIGVVVPQINYSFFSDVISGIEEVCSQNNHTLIICQSHDSYKQECLAVETLIHNNVDCVFISVAAETQSATHLEEIKKHDIELIQFDRCVDQLDGYKVLNDNESASFEVVEKLIEQGYKRIAFIGGPVHLNVFRDRKEGYLRAIKKHGLSIPYNFIIDNALSNQTVVEAATELLSLEEPPDAFFNVSDHQSLTILKIAKSMGIEVPQQLGIFGFANEIFSGMISPSLSSVDQKSKLMGNKTANFYFNHILNKREEFPSLSKEIIKTEIIVRESSKRNNS